MSTSFHDSAQVEIEVVLFVDNKLAVGKENTDALFLVGVVDIDSPAVRLKDWDCESCRLRPCGAGG